MRIPLPNPFSTLPKRKLFKPSKDHDHDDSHDDDDGKAKKASPSAPSEPPNNAPAASQPSPKDAAPSSSVIKDNDNPEVPKVTSVAAPATVTVTQTSTSTSLRTDTLTTTVTTNGVSTTTVHDTTTKTVTVTAGASNGTSVLPSMGASVTDSLDLGLAKALTLLSHPSTTLVPPQPEAKANASVSATMRAAAVPQASHTHVQKAVKGVNAAEVVAIVFGLLTLILLVVLGILGRKFYAICGEQHRLRNRVQILELTGGQKVDEGLASEGIVGGVASMGEVRGGECRDERKTGGVVKEGSAVQDTQVDQRVMEKPRKGRWGVLKMKESWE